jgi:hypothetical protein
MPSFNSKPKKPFRVRHCPSRPFFRQPSASAPTLQPPHHAISPLRGTGTIYFYETLYKRAVLFAFFLLELNDGFLSLSVTCISRAYVHACNRGLTGAFLIPVLHVYMYTAADDISGGIRDASSPQLTVNPRFILKSVDAVGCVVSMN